MIKHGIITPLQNTWKFIPLIRGSTLTQKPLRIIKKFKKKKKKTLFTSHYTEN